MNVTRKTLVAGLVVTTFVLGACQTTQEDTGRVIGAIAGGVLGSKVGGGSGKTAATIAGTFLGGFIGGELGKQMDQNDRYRANQALESAPTNYTTSWSNPDTGNDYAVTPTRTYYSDSRACREYTTDAWIEGRKETIYGTACRNSDGSWQVSN